MSPPVSAVWSRQPPAGIEKTLRTLLDSACRRHKRLRVFFRADDIARVDQGFQRLMHLFQENSTPLCLAVVPGWLREDDWRDMRRFNPESGLWCWHQHGFRHENHERQGKKSEFGPSRERRDIRHDLALGRTMLAEMMGDLFFPAFTPPWNRCGDAALELLEELGFLALSRSLHARPSYDGRLPEFAVNVDLHTRREADWREGWDLLLQEFSEAAVSGRIGVMLHHERMNEQAFLFLAMLLPLLREHENISCATFRELL
jgi:hypothetical protein